MTVIVTTPDGKPLEGALVQGHVGRLRSGFGDVGVEDLFTEPHATDQRGIATVCDPWALLVDRSDPLSERYARDYDASAVRERSARDANVFVRFARWPVVAAPRARETTTLRVHPTRRVSVRAGRPCPTLQVHAHRELDLQGRVGSVRSLEETFGPISQDGGVFELDSLGPYEYRLTASGCGAAAPSVLVDVAATVGTIDLVRN